MTLQTAFAEKQPGQDEGAILGDNSRPPSSPYLRVCIDDESFLPPNPVLFLLFPFSMTLSHWTFHERFCLSTKLRSLPVTFPPQPCPDLSLWKVPVSAMTHALV